MLMNRFGDRVIVGHHRAGDKATLGDYPFVGVGISEMVMMPHVSVLAAVRQPTRNQTPQSKTRRDSHAPPQPSDAASESDRV